MRISFNSILLTVLLLISSTSVFAQDSVYCIDLNQPDFEHYDLFNQDIEGRKIIMIGEIHYKAANSLIKADLLIYLNKHYGVRHLLLEYGRAEAYLYNRYLQTGDGWYLKHTFPGESGYQEFFTSWDKLYHYNKDLPDSGKLIVHGLDFEREPGLSASLYTLLSKYASNLEVERLRNTIKARLDTIGIERDTKEFILYLREKIPALSLPPDANKKVMDDIINNESFVSRLDKRDSLMAETFVAIDTTNEIYLGQFGLAHTMLNSSRGLGKLLNSHEKYHNKILVTNMFYVDTSNDNYPFKNLSDCPVFLYRIDPQDQQYGGFAKRGQWTLILKDQPNYTTVKKDLK